MPSACRAARSRTHAPGWPPATAPRSRARVWCSSVSARSSRCRRVRAARSRSAATCSTRVSSIDGRAGPAPAASAARRAAAARGRAGWTTARPRRAGPGRGQRTSSARSGTARLAASVGVDARTSATKSTSGVSVSWPIAEITGVRQAKTARHSASSENGQQVLHAAAAAGHDDHVDARVLVEDGERVEDLGDRADGPCTATLITRNSTAGQRRRALVEHVALGRAGPSGDQADPGRQERQAPLAGRVEQALGGEQLLESFQPGQQFAQPDLADLVGAQRERAAVGVEVRLGVHDDPGALAEVRHPRVEHVAVRGHGEADVGGGSRRVRNTTLRAGPAGDLGDLPVHPDPAEPGDPGADLLADHAHRPGLLGRALLGGGAGASVTPSSVRSAWLAPARPTRSPTTTQTDATAAATARARPASTRPAGYRYAD